jgi:hypothetical protein
MLKHATFDLLIHTTPELELLLGERVAERQPVHSWPLSAVERLTTASGVRWIYKAQRAPTCEPDFYERVRSPMLPASRLLSRGGVYSTMLFEFIDAPLMRDLAPPADELARHGHALVEAIGEIGASGEDVPVYIDVGAVDRWETFVDAVLAGLAELVADGRLSLSADASIGEVAAWAASADVRQLVEETSRLTHGDLNVGNVFVTDGGYRVIDWQRPQLAPAEVDLVSLLEGTPDLFRHASAPAIGVFYLLRLHWAVTAKRELLPHVRDGLFDRWASDAIGFIRRAADASR